jgi:four helix bundle protein
MTDSNNLSDKKSQTRHEQLEKRMLIFATDTITELKKHKTLPRSVTDQLTRSCASIGANYAEACNASSKLDFRNKIFVAKKEAAETRYWIDLCTILTKSEDWAKLRQESHEILMILQTIINTMKERSSK